MAEKPHMWTYWRDKRGILEAAESDYPELVASDPKLRLAVQQAKASLAAIDRILTQHAEDNPYDYDADLKP